METSRRRAFVSVVALLAGLSVSAPLASAQDLAEGNAANWTTFASDGASTSVSDDATHVQAGASSIRFDTQSGFDTGVAYPRAGDAHWNLSDRNYLTFWAYAVNTTPIGFQGSQPVVVLQTSGGSIRYEPRDNLMVNNAWRLYRIPLGGDSQWLRSDTGTPTIADVNRLEIHQDTWDAGFTIYYDGVQFVQLNPGAMPPAGPPPPPGVSANAVAPRVLLVIYDPIMQNKGGVRMHDAYGWANPAQLAAQVVTDLRTSSHDMARYDIVETRVVDGYSPFVDGFRYDDASFDRDWTARTPHPSQFDYVRFALEQGVGPRIEAGDIDEVWVYNAPYAGMWESTMGGDGGYWCNSPPVQGVASRRAFVIMGWNFERGVGEAIHSFGHRAESILVHSYGAWRADRTTTWNRFTLLDRDAPGRGGVGNVHFPVNGAADYDYANPRAVLSGADDWLFYPNLTGLTRLLNATEWSPGGVDPQREYLNWWYAHMPHMPGRGSDFFLANWWRYILDPDQFKSWDGNLYFSTGIPSVTTVGLTDNGVVSGLVSVKANAKADGALGRVDLYVDGMFVATDSLAPYSFTWDTRGLSGRHTVITKAYELQNGTEAVSAPITVAVSESWRGKGRRDDRPGNHGERESPGRPNR